MRSVAFGVLFAACVCAASWAALGLVAGNVGLQRSLAGPQELLAERPAALAASVLAALLAAMPFGARATAGWSHRLGWVAALIVGDILGGAILAPALVGELRLEDAPTVTLVLAGWGAQPVAAVLGLAAGRSLRRSWSAH